MAVGHSHEDPLDDIDVWENPNVEESSAVTVHTLESVETSPASSVDHRKDRDAVAPDRDDNCVVDGSGNSFGSVNCQEASSCVDNIRRCKAECLVVLDGFKHPVEIHIAAGNSDVGLAVKPCACVRSSQVERACHDLIRDAMLK